MDKLLTLSELSTYLGIGKTKTYQLVRRRDFPSLKLGGEYRILSNKLAEWLEKQSKLAK